MVHSSAKTLESCPVARNIPRSPGLIFLLYGFLLLMLQNPYLMRLFNMSMAGISSLVIVRWSLTTRIQYMSSPNCIDVIFFLF